MDEQKKLNPEENEEKGAPRRFSKRMYYILLVIFGTAFLLSAIYIGSYFWQTESAAQDYDKLEDIYLSGNQQITSTPASGIPGINPTTPTSPTMLPSLQPIYELNSDTVGYLRFPESVGISYPVMQSPYDEDFYLYHKFDKTPNGDVAIGCPFAHLKCDVFAPSDNIIICGHYLKTGGMFAPLTKYLDQEFWEENQYFTFDTLYEQHTYQIFAVFKTAARQYLEDGTPYGYPFHTKVDFDSAEDFDQYISDIKGEAFVSGRYTGISCVYNNIVPQYGDKLLTLYTCEYSIKDPYTGEGDGRLVIVAVRVD